LDKNALLPSTRVCILGFQKFKNLLKTFSKNKLHNLMERCQKYVQIYLGKHLRITTLIEIALLAILRILLTLILEIRNFLKTLKISWKNVINQLKN
jgi:hypothetical protein